MKTYTIRSTKTGREWKKQLKGTEHLIDNDLYQLTLEIKGFKNAVKCWWNIFTNKPNHGTFIKI